MYKKTLLEIFENPLIENESIESTVDKDVISMSQYGKNKNEIAVEFTEGFKSIYKIDADYGSVISKHSFDPGDLESVDNLKQALDQFEYEDAVDAFNGTFTKGCYICGNATDTVVICVG